MKLVSITMGNTVIAFDALTHDFIFYNLLTYTLHNFCFKLLSKFAKINCMILTNVQHTTKDAKGSKNNFKLFAYGV